MLIFKYNNNLFHLNLLSTINIILLFSFQNLIENDKNLKIMESNLI